MLTPDELRQVRRLTLQAGHRADSPFSGQYRSAFRGRGVEFEEVRPYIPGDDVRHIDWNVTARTGGPHVKEFREERELTLVLAVDGSGSVQFGSGGRDGRTDKRLVIARLAGALAFAAVRTGDRVGMVRFADRVERFLPPRKRRGHAWAVVRAAFEPPPPNRGRHATDVAGAIEYLGGVLRRRAVICLISDFLAAAPFERELAVLSRRHHVNCFLVHDPLEDRVPAVGLVEVEDAETGRTRLVDSRALRARASVPERVRTLARSGARSRAVSTAEDPFLALLAHFHKLERAR